MTLDGVFFVALPCAPADRYAEDRSLFRHGNDRERGYMAIVSSIISLRTARSECRCRGRRDEEQRKLLRLLRCDQMQGYLFSRPVAKDELENLLRSDLSKAAAEPAGSCPNLSLPNDASSDAHRRAEIDLLLESERCDYRVHLIDATYRRRKSGNMHAMTTP